METKYIDRFDNFICEDTKSEPAKSDRLETARRIWKLIENGDDFGIISADNPVKDSETNMERQDQLEKELLRMKYGYIEFNVAYSYQDEKGKSIVEQKALFVPKIAKAELMRLGKTYEQESVIFGNAQEVDSFRISDGKPEISLELADMMFAWSALLFSPGTFRRA